MTAPAPLLEPGPAGPLDILIVAGEHSGDQHAAQLVAELRAHRPDIRLAALGGPALADAGVPVLHDMTATSAVGLVEVLKHLGYFKQIIRETVGYVAEHRPKVVLFVDYPGMNLRLARMLTEAGVSRQGGGDVGLYFYISPQLWAWKGKRRFLMERTLDELAVIFPFETEVYADTQLPVHFVGHPFVTGAEERNLTYDAAGPVLLLPGSRTQPVKRILPALLAAVEHWRGQSPAHRERPLRLPTPDDRIRAVVEPLVTASGLPVEVTDVRQPTTAAAVLTSSGTMSLRCALAGIPGAIVYRAHPLTYAIARRVVKVPYIGIANLILQRDAYPEFLQNAARPAALAQQLDRLLEPDGRTKAKADAEALHATLSAPVGESLAERLFRFLPAAG